MFSYLDHLECSVCGATYPHDKPIRTCTACNKVLLARYDLQRLKREVQREAVEGRQAGMWAFSELLPASRPEDIITLGEGGTPLLHAQRLGESLGMPSLYIKDEGLNPTGTFKARGLAAAVSKAKEVGLTRLIMPSAGNAAGAMAAYAARGGLESHVYMPQDAPDGNKLECITLGSELNLVDGHIGDAGVLSRARAAEEGMFDLSTMQEPYRAEGKKTMGLEIAMQLGWRMPDAIIYPTGGGTGIIGMYKGYQELLGLGWVEGRLPRFIAVQAEGCQPVVHAYESGAEASQAWPNPHTVADGLRVPHPFADYLVLEAIRETGGTALTVSDSDMVDAMREMAAAEGVFACPEGAATLVASKRLLASGELDPEGTTVLLNTGSAYKYLNLLGDG